MLDNKEINEQFTREGWEKMRQVLDVEMPVNEPRKKRPVFWIWLQATGIAASILLGVSGLWWTMTKESIAMANEHNAAAITTPALIRETQGNTASEGDDAPKAAAVQTPAQKEGIISQQAEQVIKRKQGAHTLSTIAKAGSGQTLEASLALTDKATYASSNPEGSKAANPEVSFPSAEGAEAFSSVETALLPGRKPNALILNESPLPVQPLPVSKLSASWHHGPEIGGISSFPTSLTGFHAGWVAEVPVSGQLSIRSGLRYDFQRQTVSSNDRIQLRESTAADVAIDPFNPVTTVVNSSFGQPDTVSSSSTLKMHYIAMPLALSWKLNARWRAESGIQVAYLLRAFRESRDFSNSFDTTGINVVAYDNNRSWFFSNSAQEVSEASFQPWDLALSAGIRYQIAQHWNVGLSGNYGLLNQAHKSSGYRIFNRNAVLSVGYYF